MTVLQQTAVINASTPGSIKISAREFVEVAHQSRLVVTSSCPNGLEQEMWSVGTVATFYADGGDLYLRNPRGASIPLTLSFRFRLEPGTIAGCFPRPSLFDVRQYPLSVAIDGSRSSRTGARSRRGPTGSISASAGLYLHSQRRAAVETLSNCLGRGHSE